MRVLLPTPGNYKVVCVDPARKDATALPPSSFIMPLPTGYHVTSLLTVPPDESGATLVLDRRMEDTDAADEAAPM